MPAHGDGPAKPGPAVAEGEEVTLSGSLRPPLLAFAFNRATSRPNSAIVAWRCNLHCKSGQTWHTVVDRLPSTLPRHIDLPTHLSMMLIGLANCHVEMHVGRHMLLFASTIRNRGLAALPWVGKHVVLFRYLTPTKGIAGWMLRPSSLILCHGQRLNLLVAPLLVGTNR